MNPTSPAARPRYGLWYPTAIVLSSLFPLSLLAVTWLAVDALFLGGPNHLLTIALTLAGGVALYVVGQFVAYFGILGEPQGRA